MSVFVEFKMIFSCLEVWGEKLDMDANNYYHDYPFKNLLKGVKYII